MDSIVRRAAAFAAVSMLALATPVVGALAAVPFALLAVVGRTLTDGVFFDLFAGPDDRVAGELRGLVGFALAATALALFAALTGLPDAVFVVTVLLLGFGNLGEAVVRARRDVPEFRAGGFVGAGGVAAIVGLGVAAAITGVPVDAAVIFLAVVGALLAALLRAAFGRGEDPAVMVSVALGLWLLSGLGISVTAIGLAAATAVAGGFGLLSLLVGAASVTGMLTGIVIGLLTIVLGGYGWFVAFLAFAGIGGLASKYRYEEKRAIGAAQENRGARSGRNVLGNTAVGLLAVMGFAATSELSVDPLLFVFAFAGSLATAMGDTLSSEVGMLVGPPRLITTFEPVDPGTDGGVSAGGSVAGLGGTLVIAAVAVGFIGVPPAGAAVIALAGVAGMFTDSVLGATLEGRWIGNHTVNLLATLAGAMLGVAGAVAAGMVS